MKTKHVQTILLIITIFFYVIAFPPLQSTAASTQIEIVIKVNEKGFFGAAGKPLNNLIEVPENQPIKLTFEHAGQPGEKHAFVLLFDSDEEIGSETLSDLNKRTHIEFKTGESGETYDVFCILVDCDGMEHLIDLVITVI